MYEFKFVVAGKGQITIDDYQEYFESDHTYWSMDQYEEQWASARGNLKEGKPSMFITSITNPETANFIRAWAGYPNGKKAVFQEHIVFISELRLPFNLTNPHLLLEEYNSKTEEGESISEWVTNIE